VYCANNPINYTDPSGHYRVWIPTWSLEIAIDGVVPFIPIIGPVVAAASKALKPLRYASKKSTSALLKTSTKIYKMIVKFKKVGKLQRNKIASIIKKYTGINVPIHNIWKKITSITYGEIKGKIYGKYNIPNLSMFTSVGAFVSNIVDYKYNGYFRGKIPLF